MQNPMPYFKYRFVNISNKRVPCIETGGRIIHEIRNLDEFYKMFGYTREVSKAGLLPDEFIWSEYIKDSNEEFSDCLQMHIVQYLRMYSKEFNREYGDQADAWLAEHINAKARRGIVCKCKAA